MDFAAGTRVRGSSGFSVEMAGCDMGLVDIADRGLLALELQQAEEVGEGDA